MFGRYSQTINNPIILLECTCKSIHIFYSKYCCGYSTLFFGAGEVN